jgi:hypothetical protein
MNPEIAQLIVHSITQACAGKYASFSRSEPPPNQKEYRHITTMTIPTITSLAGVSSDFGVHGSYNTAIKENDLAICFDAFAVGLQNFVSVHAHALSPDMFPWINLHISPDGEVYAHNGDNAPTWNLTEEHPLYTWATTLIDVMAEGFDYDTASHHIPNWDGVGFRIEAQDNRIKKVFDIYQRVRNASAYSNQ